MTNEELYQIIRDGFAGVNHRIDETNHRIDETNKRIDALSNKTESSFVEVRREIHTLHGEKEGAAKTWERVRSWAALVIAGVALVATFWWKSVASPTPQPEPPAEQTQVEKETEPPAK